MTRIGLVACGGAKLDHPALARDLYISPLFRAASAYAEAHYDHWYVLSAKHGLVHPYYLVEPYDESLGRASMAMRRGWALRVAYDLGRVTSPGDTLFIHAGELYREWAYAHALPVQIEVPLFGLRIGEQLRWYKQHATPQEETHGTTT